MKLCQWVVGTCVSRRCTAPIFKGMNGKEESSSWTFRLPTDAKSIRRIRNSSILTTFDVSKTFINIINWIKLKIFGGCNTHPRNKRKSNLKFFQSYSFYFHSLVCTSCYLVPEFWQVTKKPTKSSKCPVTRPSHRADPTPRPLVAIQSLSDLKEVAETSLKGRLRQELGKLKKNV